MVLLNPSHFFLLKMFKNFYKTFYFCTDFLCQVSKGKIKNSDFYFRNFLLVRNLKTHDCEIKRYALILIFFPCLQGKDFLELFTIFSLIILNS